MKLRNTLTLAILAGGFFAYIYFVEQHTETTRENSESSAKVVAVEQGKINAISIQNAEAKVELAKKDGVWRIEVPLSDRADSSGVSQLLGLIESLRHDSKISIPPAQRKEKLQEFGVAESDLRVKLKSETGKETELLLGKDSAVEGKLYARVQGADTVFVISNPLRNQLTKKPDEFRDRKLSDTTPQQVQRLSVKTAEGELELERKSNHWEILKPLKARGADSKINDLIAGILNATVAKFYPESPTPDQGLAEPRGTISMTVEGMAEPLTLKVGASSVGEENKGQSFSQLSNRAAVTLLNDSSVDPLLKARPNDLRDRRLARFETDVVDRITIMPPGKSDIILARKGEGWIQKEGEKEVPINESIPQKIISTMQSTDVTNFVSDVATELPKYGLEKPILKVKLSSFASENTAESKAGERALATVLFGTVEGDSGYAKLEDEPFIVASPKTLLESIPVHPAQLQPLSIFEFKREQASALEIKNESGLTKIVKKENSWKNEAGEAAVNEESLYAVLGVLGSMRTTKWFAPGEIGEEATSTPTATIKITVQEGEKSTTHTLTVGRPLGEEGYYAQVSGKEGTFLLAKPDGVSLAIKLLQQEK